ncbi:hypothetical protein [Pleomorphomonas carboxyditropha]|uniref:Uncharacterized protein n=1 Tax=Pleomorphomonas carboxyditropha TaxID=2023338 RepID=A0A2G9X054_9HYPH|nr:hypothetical protein [Pleomorphomonas carboxyditropha]PIP00348.1 hypothetical protein CJ014_06335 [Pleomorphomonas carboxyditropha]
MFRMNAKLAKIRAGNYAKGDFIIADAKDGDMSNPIPGTGPVRDEDGKFVRFRTRAEFLEMITQLIRQDLLDIMLVSCSNLELLQEAGAFRDSPVRPAFRANDTTDIWGARPDGYGKLGPSRPFRTPSLKRIAEAKIGNLGLYSITFVNDIEADLKSLEAFRDFREDAAANGIEYFLEVFNPNVECGIAPSDIGSFVNDNLARCLSGVLKVDRPQFLKYPYNGAKALEELASYDPQLVVGVLGGGAGTTRDTFELLYQAEKYGARVALFGRKINLAESQLDMVRHMRAVADGDMQPLEAVRSYHAVLRDKGIAAVRSLEDDSAVTETVLMAAASA